MNNINQTSFKIREATINDVLALAALHVKTFSETHGEYPNCPTYELREYQWQKAFQEKDDSWFCFVIEEKAQLIGFAKGQSYNHPVHAEFLGELNKIYLLRAYHHLGLGRQLVCKVANEFIRRGINSMLLFGDANNPSNQFYERMGAEKLFTEHGEFHGGYGWRDLQKFTVNHCTT